MWVFANGTQEVLAVVMWVVDYCVGVDCGICVILFKGGLSLPTLSPLGGSLINHM